MYTHIHTCMHTYICIHTHTRTHTHKTSPTQTLLCMFLLSCTGFLRGLAPAQARLGGTYIYIHIYVCVYVCMYIYTHTYTHTHKTRLQRKHFSLLFCRLSASPRLSQGSARRAAARRAVWPLAAAPVVVARKRRFWCLGWRRGWRLNRYSR